MDRIYVYGVDGNDHKVQDISDSESGLGYFSDYVKALEEGEKHKTKCADCADFRVEGPEVQVWGRTK